MSNDHESADAGRPPAEPTAATRSRREFLTSTIPGLALSTACPVVVASPAAAGELTKPRHPLEELLRRYGSELGDLKQLS
jgi:hypothetical protein